MAAAGGAWVAVHYHQLGLTLSHYDARGHLVVARRIVDSLTPGWQQTGAVWLPLPHLLNAIPVQVDAWYRTGASAVAISVAAFAVAVVAIARIIRRLTGSTAACVAGAAVFALNPNVLYLQATPMTEPLLLALATLAVALLLEWCDTAPPWSPTSGGPIRLKPDPTRLEPDPTIVGVVFALACWTRYEAWPVTASALAVAVWARWRRGESFSLASRRVGAIAVFPVLAIAGFAAFSRVVVGEWFTTGGFFVPENKALGDPVMAAAEMWWGMLELSGPLLTAIAVAGMATILLMGFSARQRASMVVALALVAAAAVPWVAFFDGHPFRIRYMVPLIAMQAIAVGTATLLLPRWRLIGALVVLSVAAYELRPLDHQAPMVVEAQWDLPNVPVRDQVTTCLGAPRPGQKIMASMGSLGHYMQQASRAGFELRDFLHEGNGDIWLAALGQGPRPFVDWILIEEKAEGGDMLAERARQDPHFLDGYSRACEGAGLALYRRD